MSAALQLAPDAERQTFLLVHGAWHSAAHWNRLAEQLTARGHVVDAIDLPGSGLEATYPAAYLTRDTEALAGEKSPIAAVTLDDYRDAIVERLQRLGGDVTLVGHSMGGLAITAAAEAAPHLVRRLVYLSAYVPSPQAKSGAELGALPEGATSLSGAILVGDPMQTGAMRIDPRNADPAYVEAGRRALYNDMPTEEYLRFAAYFNPDYPLAVAFADARGTAGRWGALPRMFIRLTEDHTVPPALQDRMIADADTMTPGNRFDVRELASSHSAFASMPDRLAAILEAAE
jgi:pimeloyl-ACP methyl ester carboxylesterase